MHAQGGRGLGAKPRLADFLAALPADAVFAVLDPGQGRVNLADEQPVPFAHTQRQLPIRFQCGPIRGVGVQSRIPSQVRQGFP